MPPKFKWNQKANRYVDHRGRFVKWSTISNEIDLLNVKLSNDARKLAISYKDGDISLQDFRTQLMQQVKITHISSAVLASGGWDNMRPSDYGRAGQIIRTEYGLVNNLISQIESGEQKLDGSFIRRVGQYGQQSNPTYYKFHDTHFNNNGFDLEASLLNPADHCSQCVSEARKGYVKIGTLIPIGNRICRSGCKCSKTYKNSTTGEEQVI